MLKWIALCLITLIAAHFLHLCACFTCSSVHVSTLHPLLAHHHLCYVDVHCTFLFLYFIFAVYLSFFVSVHVLLSWFLLFCQISHEKKLFGFLAFSFQYLAVLGCLIEYFCKLLCFGWFLPVEKNRYTFVWAIMINLPRTVARKCSVGGLYVCARRLDIENLLKSPLIHGVWYINLGTLGLCLEGRSPPKHPRRDGAESAWTAN